MKVAEFPQRKCREHVPYGIGDGEDAIPMVALCEIRETHLGPCASYSAPESVARREAWEAANPGWEDRVDDDPFV